MSEEAGQVMQAKRQNSCQRPSLASNYFASTLLVKSASQLVLVLTRVMKSETFYKYSAEYDEIVAAIEIGQI